VCAYEIGRVIASKRVEWLECVCAHCTGVIPPMFVITIMIISP
jgi:hypothetical protein